MKKILFVVLSVCLLCSFISCNSEVKSKGTSQQTAQNFSSSKVVYETNILTSEDELNALATRGDDEIVDWQLSKEFAQLWLESGIEAGDYPVDSVLWEIPIAVYNAEGEVQYYEFRVVSETNVVAAITGAARKKFGCPILYEFLTDGYSDEITEFYNSGKFSSETLPRVVDNGYPTIVFGTTTITRGADDGFDGFIDPKTGNQINEEDIATPLTYEEAKEICPDMLPEYIDDAKMQALVEDFKKNGEEFWKLAVANRGHIADFAVRGGSKSEPERTAISSDRLNNYRKYVNKKRNEWNGYTYRSEKGSSYYSASYDKDKIINYGAACASVATGFVLDFIHANCMSLPAWDSLSYEERHDALYDLLDVWPVYLFGEWEGDAAWWWNLKNPIKYYTDNRYGVTGSGVYCYPKTAINKNMPGISLRTWKVSNNSFGHYRPVIAFEKYGWLCFSWYEFKILDRVDCSDTVNGSWETYIPLYHLGSYDVW